MLDWLKRPGQEECGNRWPLIRKFNYELTGCELPDNMPSEERRQVDVVYQRKIVRCFIYKLDEKQHFNAHRAVTLNLYPTNFAITFSIDRWVKQSERKSKPEGGWPPRASSVSLNKTDVSANVYFVMH